MQKGSFFFFSLFFQDDAGQMKFPGHVYYSKLTTGEVEYLFCFICYAYFFFVNFLTICISHAL